MTTAESPRIQSQASAVAAESMQALTAFLSALWGIGSVKRVGVSGGGAHFDLWALMSEELLPDAERIFLLHRRLRESVQALPIGLHIVPLSEIDESNLPPLRILFER